MKRNGTASTEIAGFSLVEIAVVLVILSVLIAIVAVPLATQIEQRRAEETLRQLEGIKEALMGFASSKGRLPCPATATSDGQEYFCTTASGGCTATKIEMAHGRCVAHANSLPGFLPAVTLGISPVDPNGFAIDAWGLSQNRIRYAVANTAIAVAGTPPACPVVASNIFTSSTTGMRTATMSCLADNAITLLTICGVTPTGAVGAATACSAPLATKAPFVLISLGKNAPVGGTGTDEAHNVDADAYFVSHTPTLAGSASGEFDDIVTWGSLNTLFARMVQAGKLP